MTTAELAPILPVSTVLDIPSALSAASTADQLWVRMKDTKLSNGEKMTVGIVQSIAEQLIATAESTESLSIIQQYGFESTGIALENQDLFRSPPGEMRFPYVLSGEKIPAASAARLMIRLLSEHPVSSLRNAKFVPEYKDSEYLGDHAIRSVYDIPLNTNVSLRIYITGIKKINLLRQVQAVSLNRHDTAFMFALAVRDADGTIAEFGAHKRKEQRLRFIANELNPEHRFATVSLSDPNAKTNIHTLSFPVPTHVTQSDVDAFTESVTHTATADGTPLIRSVTLEETDEGKRLLIIAEEAEEQFAIRKALRDAQFAVVISRYLYNTIENSSAGHPVVLFGNQTDNHLLFEAPLAEPILGPDTKPISDPAPFESEDIFRALMDQFPYLEVLAEKTGQITGETDELRTLSTVIAGRTVDIMVRTQATRTDAGVTDIRITFWKRTDAEFEAFMKNSLTTRFQMLGDLQGGVPFSTGS